MVDSHFFGGCIPRVSLGMETPKVVGNICAAKVVISANVCKGMVVSEKPKWNNTPV